MAWAEVYLRTEWRLDPSSRLTTTDMGRKLRAVSLLGRGAGSPSDTLMMPDSVPNFILIHPTVLSQYTNVTDRQTGQDNGPIA